MAFLTVCLAQDELSWSLFSVVLSSVRPSGNIFKRLLLWCRWVNFAQISCWASLGLGNDRWPFKMAVMPIYGKKSLNIFFSVTEEVLGWILAQIVVDGRSIKVAKMMLVCWRLTFLRQSQVCFPMQFYGPHTFVFEKYWEFKNYFSEAASSNFMWSLLGTGQKNLA